MSEHTDRNQSSSDRDRHRPHGDRPPPGNTRVSRIRSLTEELGRRQQQRLQPSTSSTASNNRSSGEWVLAYDSAAQNVLPPIENLVSAEEHSRSTGYRRPDQSSLRGNRDILISAILPPLPDNSDEAMDIELNNQRMDETNDDSATTRRRVADMPRPFAVRDLEGLLGTGGDGDEDDFDFTRARFPSRLRHSATATSENPPADARNERDMDPNERRWLDMLYMRMPPASSTLSPHIQALLSRRAADGGRLDASGRDALWNLMLEEDGSDDGEDDESEWERTSSPGEISHRGATRNAAELLAELTSAAGGAPLASAQSLPLPSLVPSRPATNAHLRGSHAPHVVGSSNRITSHTRTTGRGQAAAGRGESSVPLEESASGASLRRRKSIKRRRIESGMDISYPYPIMTSANSEPIPNSSLPEYMQLTNTPILAIPTTFNPLDKCARLTISPSTSSDIVYGPLVTVKFIGTGARGDADAAAVRTDHSIPPTCGIYYYEATIVSKGKDGYISIGLSNRFTNLSRLVGWEPGSYAWHMDDGFVFEGRGEGTSKGWPTSTTGDVIGCGVDFTTGKAFFTKNGQMIGHAFKSIGPADKLYPSIGLRTPGETVQCNFTGPFTYDIVTHVRQVKRDLLNTILKKDSVDIRADVSTSEVVKPEPTPTPILVSGKSSSKNAVKKPTTLAAPPQQVIRNIDGALAPAVLSYLQHNGFFGSAAAMRKDMSSRKRLLDTGVEDSNSARHQKMAKTEKWYKTQEDAWRQLQNVKRDYQANRLSKVWDTLRDNVKPSIAYPDFLDSYDGLWSCRIRTRYFYKIVCDSFDCTDSKATDSVDQITVNLPGLKEDPEFKTFVLGDLDLSGLLESGTSHEFDASSILLALGHHLRDIHGDSSNPLVKQAVDEALSYMPYVSTSDLPAEMYGRISKTALTQEAEELVRAIREHQGKPVKSALEEAFAREDQTLRNLGNAHHFAPASFVGVEDIVRGVE
ncbi:hypothetical protein QFC22_005478 [Naganishia vaughanmartiniae]|uniref:Uncharacterized protein n=1 Tax=Naganishia vaughanmartiniae TaxID=1424756 RepID=A0ACC2WTH7_9TREE|nr:hypothetical protein QFC22_005478 [Naganishia vaughanmartiniae]